LLPYLVEAEMVQTQLPVSMAVAAVRTSGDGGVLMSPEHQEPNSRTDEQQGIMAKL
jgi:hypothetical protein